MPLLLIFLIRSPKLKELMDNENIFNRPKCFLRCIKEICNVSDHAAVKSVKEDATNICHKFTSGLVEITPEWEKDMKYFDKFWNCFRHWALNDVISASQSRERNGGVQCKGNRKSLHAIGMAGQQSQGPKGKFKTNGWKSGNGVLMWCHLTDVYVNWWSI